MSDVNSVLTQYNKEREELIRQDRALRVDSVKLDNLTAAEAKAECIVRAIRAEEAMSVWDAETEAVPHPFPGMEFLTSKSIIQTTKIFKILHKVVPYSMEKLFPTEF
jgi:adenosine deaminase CECR1